MLDRLRTRTRKLRRSPNRAPQPRLGDTDANPLPYGAPYWGLLHALYALEHDIYNSATAADAVQAFAGAEVMRTVNRLIFSLAVRVVRERMEADQDPEGGPARERLERVLEHLRAADDHLRDAVSELRAWNEDTELTFAADDYSPDCAAGDTPTQS